MVFILSTFLLQSYDSHITEECKVQKNSRETYTGMAKYTYRKQKCILNCRIFITTAHLFVNLIPDLISTIYDSNFI